MNVSMLRFTLDAKHLYRDILPLYKGSNKFLTDMRMYVSITVCVFFFFKWQLLTVAVFQ